MIKDEKPHWTVDRKVPLAMIFAIVMQTMGAVWWAASVNSRLQYLEENDKITNIAVQELSEIKVHMEYQRKALEAIEEHLRSHSMP
jgi:hypothetical protein